MIDVNNYYWHDSTILKIEIDRSSPGINDQVVIHVSWADSDSHSRIILKNCWKVLFDMNMGIIANESIDNVDLFMEHEEIDKLKAKWKGHSELALGGIFLFELKTSSTGSCIRILATEILIENLA
ncbi:MAG: hypothetical protein H6620_10460 [Halobacteriovoraceae bacterium]|nr:hypothetical protein [Halobacteriovoraceae bacterium]